jgi:cupin superfamily acireductone dioxygenase involved in methionine salvage
MDVCTRLVAWQQWGLGGQESALDQAEEPFCRTHCHYDSCVDFCLFGWEVLLLVLLLGRLGRLGLGCFAQSLFGLFDSFGDAQDSHWQSVVEGWEVCPTQGAGDCHDDQAEDNHEADRKDAKAGYKAQDKVER